MGWIKTRREIRSQRPYVPGYERYPWLATAISIIALIAVIAKAILS